MKGKKYLLLGGIVYSKNDGQSHYVNAHQLMRLYGLDESECVLLEENQFATDQHRGLKILGTRWDGNYKLEPTKQEK